METEGKFDLLGAFHSTCEFHGCFAARSLEGIATPNLENQDAPQWPHVTGGLLRGCRDEEDFGGWWFRREIGFWRADDAVGDEGLLAAGFVGIETVVADGLLPLGREVVDDGGDEVGGFEDFKIAFGGMAASEFTLQRAFADRADVAGDALFGRIQQIHHQIAHGFPDQEKGFAILVPMEALVDG